jgi:hypothetical protein
VVVVTEHDPEEGGYDLIALDASGTEVERTWHGGLSIARRWASDTYGSDGVGSWRENPESVVNWVGYALRHAR